MPRVVEHLATLTAFRDRHALDVSLVGALKDLLDPECLGIHRCVGEPGHEHWITCARLARGDLIASADPIWADIDTLPKLETDADRLACLQSGQMRAVPGTPATTFFPLASDSGVAGVLQVASVQPLSAEALRMVASILRIFRNFEGLLDYSERDTLTGLLNRKTFDDSFLRLTASAGNSAGPATLSDPAGQCRRQTDVSLWLGVIDIDHFKRVNDGYGHLIGDEVLLLLSRLMRSSFRFQDQLYRFGGEEFVVLMRCAKGADAAVAFERLRANVEGYAFPQVGRITVSVGFTELRPGDSPTSAFDRADKAVYFAKQNGRNQVRHHATLVTDGQLADETHLSDIELF